MTKNNQNSISKISDNSKFNYEEFKESAIKKLYAGKGILGKEGAFTPLIKEFLYQSSSLIKLLGKIFLRIKF